jgi:hypothetical protein
MDKSEKHNIIIAAVLSVAAVVIIWYMRSGTQIIYQADPNNTAVPDTTGIAAPGAVPGYMSYNVPPYNPGGLPPINNTATVGGSAFNTDNSTGKGCCPGCAGENSGSTNTNIGSYYGLMGLGSLAGAA